ncbi:hypothetical protein KCU61_g86, partial [Aureobasidium melanogenum]
MKRHPLDISMELDSDFDMSFAHNSRNGFALTRRVTGTVYELARPMWPANDAVTPAISERKIRELECGNDDEKLMATFARHSTLIRAGSWQNFPGNTRQQATSVCPTCSSEPSMMAKPA